MSSINNLINREVELGMMRPMRNTKGENVEKYMPKKCTATSRILSPTDHAAISLYIPDVDESGKIIQGKGTTVNICGYVRDKCRSDKELMKVLRAKGVYPPRDQE